ncbi:MAG TPA: pilus assembly protein PilP [Marinospirillum sp.]|uniref:pilus assembly protein PilP n=1 Tax=Marinospirillum sp. TaxID=2183934 RepID=UPI002B481AE5|nr:pilus assembly protein PilP [Marinospirillum sp.]HKM16555.1 pilus assembly protein PilP [Marinospirillum sp.]
MYRFLLSPFLLLLIACSDSAATQAIEAQLAGLRIKPQGEIEALPHLPKILKITDTYLPARDPFLPVNNSINNLKLSVPNLNRPLTVLEQWDVAQLSFRGSMQRGKSLRAFIITPDKQLVTVVKGDRMGKNHGTIVHLDKESITLVEIISSGSEWQERKHIINLSR